MRVIAAAAALCATLALAMARLGLPLAGDVLALAAAALGLSAFVGAAVSTVRSAASLRSRSSPP